MQSDQREQRSPLGLGPLETAIMQVMWEADNWLMVRDIRDRMDYAPVAYTTVAKVTSILYEKDLLIRCLGEREGKPGPSAWWYRAARPMSEHIGELIAKLLDYSPNPEATLAYALAAATTRLPSPAGAGDRPVAGRFAVFDAELDRQHPAGTAHHHLAMLAVRPDMQGQGQGIGTALLSVHHRVLNEAGIPGYLEGIQPALPGALRAPPAPASGRSALSGGRMTSEIACRGDRLLRPMGPWSLRFMSI